MPTTATAPAAAAEQALRIPDRDTLARLAAWEPPLGVLSVCVAIDPGDRREGWRVALGEGLQDLIEGAEGREQRFALEATAEHVRAHFPDEVPLSGRTHFGFVGVSAEKKASPVEQWFGLQMPADETRVIHRPRPHLRPFLELLDDGAPVGVAIVSAERIALSEWALGFLEKIEDRELGVSRSEWHERKAPASDPSRGTAVSASGHDQHGQRLEANRRRFLHESASRVAKLAAERGWRALLLFGEAARRGEFERALPHQLEVFTAEAANLLNEERATVLEHVERSVAELNRRRERDLVERTKAAALAREGHGSLGVEPTREALALARVAHLVIDAEHERRPAERDQHGLIDPETAEQLIEGALATGAEVTPVEGEAADALIEHDGVGALLRY
jgi:Bacterial archaeo-eukaryotic release factor family 10